MQPIQIAAKEILERKINESLDKFPHSLTVKKLSEILNCDSTQVYKSLNKGMIPGAKKIPGMGWRINRDVFLVWFYANETEQ